MMKLLGGHISFHFDHLTPSRKCAVWNWNKCPNKFCSLAVGKLMELHGEGGAGSAAKATGDDTGAKVERADGYEPPIQESV